MSAAAAVDVVVVLMGVSGSGKSTVGEKLAAELGCPFLEGDDFHPAANVAKMKRGIALTTADREPWLTSIAAKIDDLLREKQPAVISCSALQRAYRDIIIGNRPRVALVYLKGSYDLIRHRLEGRHGHFMPASLLKSQFDALEEPAPDEHPIVVDIALPPAEICAAILHGLEERFGARRRSA
ncbi:MAG TPA: gluconokinase [Dongiaceae bacterium]|nr:gluconokinase [Dongiaceae bacterium]